MDRRSTNLKTNSHPTKKVEAPSRDLDGRLQSLLDLHFHPTMGAAYWLRRQDMMGWDVRDRIRTVSDLSQLGPMPMEDLRRFPVKDFIPSEFHQSWPRFILGETAGTSGAPVATAFRDDEFQQAFVEPFLKVAGATGFPTGAPWLWIGPSGPHVIGKAVRELARQTGCLDPFSVDFDPRWAKRLEPGSTALARYLDHVTSQALDVLEREEIGVLFATPPALGALAQRMTDRQREAIRGVHYGGMSLTAQTVNHFREAFPSAVHLAGYGNTLFGVVMEVEDHHRLDIDYFPLAERVLFQTVQFGEEGRIPWPPQPAELNQPGRVMFHRLDESCLLVNVIERDLAEAIPLNSAAIALGATRPGLRNPRVPETLEKKLQLGLY